MDAGDGKRVVPPAYRFTARAPLDQWSAGVAYPNGRNRLPLSIPLDNWRELVEALVVRGGPSPQHYLLLDGFFGAVHPMVKNGQDDQRSRLQCWFGRAMTRQTLQGFVCEKPHGYSGDFEIMDKIYTFERSSDALLCSWDDYFHAQPATKAVRNRKSYFHGLLRQHLTRKKPDTLRVLKVGSGPGRSMHDFLELTPGADVTFLCVEIDAKAVAYASELNRRYFDRITFINRSVFRYEPAQQFDLIWAAGVCDYLSDRAFEYLLRLLYPGLAPGGEMVVGNFALTNPSRAYMEFGSWFLNHRTAADLIDLGRRATGASVRVSQESEGVNLFLHVRRE